MMQKNSRITGLLIEATLIAAGFTISFLLAVSGNEVGLSGDTVRASWFFRASYVLEILSVIGAVNLMLRLPRGSKYHLGIKDVGLNIREWNIKHLLIGLFAGAAYYPIAHFYSRIHTIFPDSLPNIIILAILIPAVCEEIAVRGVIFRWSMKLFEKKSEPIVLTLSIIISSSVYALLHFGGAMRVRDMAFLITTDFWIFFAFGAILALLFHWKKTLLPSIATHATYNSIVYLTSLI